MQGKWYLASLSAMATLALSTASYAVMSVPDGWYLEANVGSAHLSNKSYPGKSSSSGIGGSGNLGYKFMPYFAAEINYSQYPSTTIKNFSNTKAGTDKHYSYGIIGKGILPMQDTGFEFFAKLGVQRINSSLSINNYNAAASIGLSSSHHSTTGLAIGAGGQYYFMPEFAIVAQWMHAQGNSSTGNEDLFSGGISFIFD
jgi:hypothetical protein